MEECEIYSNFYSLIEEYETIIKTLNSQLESFKGEHADLKQDVAKILLENDELAKALRNSTTNLEEQCEFKPEYKCEENGDAITNLKVQLELALQEKSYVSELWQSALKNIDYLEQELMLYEGRHHGYVSKDDVFMMKTSYEKQISDLQKELSLSQKSLQDVLTTSQATLNEKSRDLQDALLEQKSLFQVVKKLEKDLRDLQQEQCNISELKQRLEQSLKNKDRQIEELQKKLVESKSKVSEACAVVEAALLEKDAALHREKETKEELLNVNKLISTMVAETEEKIRNELELANTKYEVKLSKYKLQLQNKEEELKAKNQDVEMLKKEYKLLEDQMNRFQKGNVCIEESNTSKLILFEKNLESTFQKLMSSEKKLIQITAERDEIRNDLEEMSRHYEKDVKSREAEKQVLCEKIQNLQMELEHSNDCLLKFSTQAQSLNEKLLTMDRYVKKKFLIKDRETQQAFTERILEICTINKKIQNELKEKLNKQVDLNKRWKVEFHGITEKMESRLKELKSEASNLRKYNKELTTKLYQVELRAAEYKTHLEKLCTEVNVVATTSL